MSERLNNQGNAFVRQIQNKGDEGGPPLTKKYSRQNIGLRPALLYKATDSV